MSYDLLVLSSSRSERARQVWVRLAEGGWTGQEPDARAAAFHREVLTRFPPLERLTDEDFDGLDDRNDVVWSMTPVSGAGHVQLSVLRPRVPVVLPVVLDLAAQHGLACYDPQADAVLDTSVAAAGSGLRLKFCDGIVVARPQPQDLAHLLGRVSPRNWYAVLEREPDWYVQVGVGLHAGSVPSGRFAVEYREGEYNRHFRCIIDNIDDVARVFIGFALGDETWKSSLSWAPALVL